MDTLELILLFDYYGNLLTDRMRECFDLRYNQDLSLGEIGILLGISRQGVHDNLSRAEALLRNMEEKTGCVGRDQNCRKAVHTILAAAESLRSHSDETVSSLAEQIYRTARELEE